MNKTKKETIIKNYAHDYRNIAMSQEELKKMFEDFLDEYEDKNLLK